MEKTSQKRQYFTLENKQLILKEHYSIGISIPVLARKYGVHAITLYNWKRQIKKKDNPMGLVYLLGEVGLPSFKIKRTVFERAYDRTAGISAMTAVCKFAFQD
jgi:hypothetical protein